MKDKKFLFQYSFYNEDDKIGFIFVIGKDEESARKNAIEKLEKEEYFSHRLSQNTLISSNLRVHDDEETGIYEVIYP